MSELREAMEALIETPDRALAQKAKKIIAAAEKDMGKLDPRAYVDLVMDKMPELKNTSHAKRVLGLLEEKGPSVSQIKRYIRQALRAAGGEASAHHMWVNAPRAMRGIKKTSIESYASDMKGITRKRNRTGDDTFVLK